MHHKIYLKGWNDCAPGSDRRTLQIDISNDGLSDTIVDSMVIVPKPAFPSTAHSEVVSTEVAQPNAELGQPKLRLEVCNLFVVFCNYWRIELCHLY